MLRESQVAGDERLIAGFHAFLALLKQPSGDAHQALAELAATYQTDRPEPYFLEQLQAQNDRAARRKHGVFFTPGPVVEWMVRRVEELVPAGPLRFVDPACGGGVFLLAAAELARRRPGSSLLGFDLSLAAVEVTRLLLADAGVPADIRQINPLLAGDELASALVSSLDSTLVILGNPPYANFGRLNRGTWIDRLVADYRHGVEEQKLNLTDDFIKFLRWGQYWLDRAAGGVLAMITSRTYLGGVTHRGMRRSLAESFPRLEIVDLHGDGELNDENVFNIRRGVCIGLFSKAAPEPRQPALVYTSLCGSRDDKLSMLKGKALPASCNSQQLLPAAPNWLFLPGLKRSNRAEEYASWLRLDEIFNQFISGVQTKNDALFVDFDRDVLIARLRALDPTQFDPALIQPYIVGPFDRRWIYYDRQRLGRARWSVMRHLLQIPGNTGLIFMRQSTATTRYDHALVVDSLASDRVFYSRRGAPFMAPLWCNSGLATPVGNFQVAWVAGCEQRLKYCPDVPAIFAYLYAILHAPSYRRDYLPELQRDFPRLPWPWSTESFYRLAELGQELVDLHLPSPPVEVPLEIQGDAPRITAAAAAFQVGGYHVIKRWLQVRRGRTLGNDDRRHLAWLIEVAAQTERIAGEIDLVLATIPSPSREP